MPALLTTSAIPAPRSYRVALALQTIKEHFGDIPRDVAALIVDIDQCSLPILLKTAAHTFCAADALSPKLIRQALLVLWKHNCLNIELPTDIDLTDITPENTAVNGLSTIEAKLRLPGILYSLNIDNILHRQRFSRLFLHARRHFGELGCVIAEEIICQGRLRYASLSACVLQRLVDLHASVEAEEAAAAAEAAASGVEPPPPMTERYEYTEEEIEATFQEMVKARYIVKAPPLDLRKRELSQVELNFKSTKKLGSLFNDNSNANALNKTASLNRAKAAAAATAALQRAKENKVVDESLPVELRLMLESNAAHDEEHSTSTMKGTRGSSITGIPRGGRGGARGARTSPNSSESTTTSQSPVLANLVLANVYWIIGFDQIVREERHNAVIDIVTDQLESVAGNIARIMAENSMNQELGANPSKSAPITLDDLFQKLRVRLAESENEAPCVSIDLVTLKKLLDVIRLSSLNTVVKVPETDNDPNGPSYVLNYEAIISALRRRTIQQIALGRFGVQSGRIIELLQRNKFLEQQAVSDKVVLPARETRERLYRLYRDQWVNYRELSKRGDFNSSTNYYFWYLDMPRLKASLLDNLYHTVMNLRLRRNAELETGRDLLELGVSSTADEVKHAELMWKLNLLDQSILRVDKTILLMEKF